MKVKTIERGAGRPKDGYTKHIPGTTTVVGRFKDSGGLMRWTWREGVKEGEARATAFHEGRPRRKLGQYNTVDKAAELGGYVHDAVEGNIHGEGGGEYFDSLGLSADDLKRCRLSYGAYEQWRSTVNINIVATEVAMVSEEHNYGGTIDAAALIDDQLCLLDWKTSNGVYRDYIVQLGGYAILWEECRGDVFDEAHLLRFSKEDGDFEHHRWDKDTLDLGRTQFLLLRKAFDLDRELKAKMGRRW